jgi:hypothetical protein
MSGEEDRIGCLQAGQRSQGATIDLKLATEQVRSSSENRLRSPSCMDRIGAPEQSPCVGVSGMSSGGGLRAVIGGNCA